ncbi:hypothetical protein UB46_16415 [Burkholderiaceae bacterium 16]|nr:hypothetical protein UB46_16415 [Burkholderiaceae bacterium 16]
MARRGLPDYLVGAALRRATLPTRPEPVQHTAPRRPSHAGWRAVALSRLRDRETFLPAHG